MRKIALIKPRPAGTIFGPHVIETISGLGYNFVEPTVDMVTLDDIAGALANTCRFGGHVDRFYSVAEHVVRVSELVEQANPWLALSGLHHDDHEAYLGDIPRPLKSLLGPEYDDLCKRADIIIADAIGYPWLSDTFHSPEVVKADNYMLAAEAAAMKPSRGMRWQNSTSEPVEHPNARDFGWPSVVAKAAYLKRHEELTS